MVSFFLSRYVERGTQDLIVEILVGGKGYANKDRLIPKYSYLGEGMEFSDPREAVKAAIELRDRWLWFYQLIDKKDQKIHFAWRAMEGKAVRPVFMGAEELKVFALKSYDRLPKCFRCGEHIFAQEVFNNDERFCSQICAAL